MIKCINFARIHCLAQMIVWGQVFQSKIEILEVLMWSRSPNFKHYHQHTHPPYICLWKFSQNLATASEDKSVDMSLLDGDLED